MRGDSNPSANQLMVTDGGWWPWWDLLRPPLNLEAPLQTPSLVRYVGNGGGDFRTQLRSNTQCLGAFNSSSCTIRLGPIRALAVACALHAQHHAYSTWQRRSAVRFPRGPSPHPRNASQGGASFRKQKQRACGRAASGTDACRLWEGGRSAPVQLPPKR